MSTVNKANLIASSRGVFESARQYDASGNDFWFARDLQPLLEYSSWQRFRLVLDKAMEACKQSGHAVADHFNRAVKMVGSRRIHKTRQGYALRSTLKPAGYFFAVACSF